MSAKPPRRVMGMGSVTLRADGRWQGRAMVEGVRKSVYGATQADVVRKLQQLQQQIAGGLPAIDQRATVGTYLTRWLSEVTPRLRTTTATRYAGLVRGQIIPAVGRIKLHQLQPSDVARMMAQVQRSGLSARTASHCRAVLRAALSDAERDGIIHRNAAKLADAPHLAPPQPTVLSPDQVWGLLDACTDPSLRRLAVVAITTGLRMGEQLGLRWADIDFERRCLHVRQSLQRAAGAYTLVEPKSATSRRVVALPESALDAFTQERQAQLEARLAAGRRWHQEIPDLCFTTAAGQPRNGTSVIHLFQDALERAGLSRLRWHDLRAAHGSLLLAGGADISVVSRKLGHSSVALTSRHYGGVADSLQQDAADRLGRLLQRPV